MCRHCDNTGELIEAHGPVLLCDCSDAKDLRLLSYHVQGPPPPTSAWLIDTYDDKRNAMLRAENKRLCEGCDAIIDNTGALYCPDCRY